MKAIDTQPHTERPQKRRGSILMLVVLLTMAISIPLATALNLGVSEKKTNMRHILRQQASNASESFVEYGFADIIERFRTKSAVGLVQNSLASEPVTLPDTINDFLAGTNIDLDKSELVVGNIPSAATEIYIDPRDPSNEYDPLKGKIAYVRRIEVLAKAVATSSFGGDISVDSYTRQVLEVRDSPLFAHAMFYNMDLELHPGPNMNIYGPVHANADAWVQAINGIDFHDTLTASGNIRHGFKAKGINSDGSLNPDDSHTQQGSVRIKNSSGAFKDMATGGDKSKDSGWLDSRDPNWRSKASQRWDGYVMDEAHGVPALNPVGIKDYEPLDMTVLEGATRPDGKKNEISNYAYALIEPVLSEQHPDFKGAAVRKEKFAYKAGLILEVEPNGSADHPYYPDGDEREEGSPSVKRNDYIVRAYRYVRDAQGDPVIDGDTGLPERVEVMLPKGLIGAASSNMRSISADGRPDLFQTDDDPDDGPEDGKVERGLFDHREDKALDMLSLDISRLSELVDDTDPNYDPDAWEDNAGVSPTDEEDLKIYNPTSDWNGVVYVQFPTTVPVDETDPNKGTGRRDKIVAGSDPYIALQAINGKRFPNPSYAREKGLTLSTNAPLYTVGHMNADGNSHSNDANMPDSADEPPAAFASDSITLLSENWYGDDSNRTYSNQSNTKNRKGKFNEFSAAILTGLKPSVPDDSPNMPDAGAQSGGAHNFPRFLEKWNNTLTIRGSLVALFESEVHRKAMPSNFNHYYGAPTRDWGFNDNFRKGNYPPGTPNTRTYRRIFFEDIPQKSSGQVGEVAYQEGYEDALKRINSGG